ncbi:MAG: TIGR00159 family protein, partial [Muribaculaceae bacterium]
MNLDFGIKDLVDILLVAAMLYYLYRAMKQSGTLNIFVGVLSFIVLWFITYKILNMQLFG